MRLAIACAVLVMTSGCFTSWAITQATGGQRILDEKTRIERVPLDDAKERLHVLMPFTAVATEPYAFQCLSTQTATDAVHQSGFRYGSAWKKVALVMFVLEAGVAAATYFAADMERTENQLAVGLLGAEALGTAALVFAPRKEIYRQETKRVYSTIRRDCPDGIAVELAGETFPIDPAGRIGELGEAALEAWRREPASAPARITYDHRTYDVRIGMSAVFEVPLGTLTSLVE
jgi:hypothetical protein